jgi:hypothetical protein
MHDGVSPLDPNGRFFMMMQFIYFFGAAMDVHDDEVDLEFLMGNMSG